MREQIVRRGRPEGSLRGEAARPVCWVGRRRAGLLSSRLPLACSRRAITLRALLASDVRLSKKKNRDKQQQIRKNQKKANNRHLTIKRITPDSCMRESIDIGCCLDSRGKRAAKRSRIRSNIFGATDRHGVSSAYSSGLFSLESRGSTCVARFHRHGPERVNQS